MSKVSLVKAPAWTPDHTDAELNQTDATDAVSEAWPIGSQVTVTWEGQEITHYSTDALLGYAPDVTETLTILAHKIRREGHREQRFLVLSDTPRDGYGGDYQYVAIDSVSDGSQITAYGANFERVTA